MYKNNYQSETEIQGQFLSLLSNALQSLGIPISIAELKQISDSLFCAMAGKKRTYHSPQHSLDVAKGMDPLQTIAALFHDCVYYHVDGGYPESISSLIQDVVTIKDDFFILNTIEEREPILQISADIFDLSTEKKSGLRSGFSEFMSAVAAVRMLAHHLTPTDMINILACIELTIPFRGPDKNGDTPTKKLSKRLRNIVEKQGLFNNEIALTNFVDSVMRRATIFANQDTGGFAQTNHRCFMVSSLNLVDESLCHPEEELENIFHYRQGLLAMSTFFERLDHKNIFNNYLGTPTASNINAMTYSAKKNTKFALQQIRKMLILIALIEASSDFIRREKPLLCKCHLDVSEKKFGIYQKYINLSQHARFFLEQAEKLCQSIDKIKLEAAFENATSYFDEKVSANNFLISLELTNTQKNILYSVLFTSSEIETLFQSL